MSHNPEHSLFTADRLITRRATLGGLMTAVLLPTLVGKASASGSAPEAQAPDDQTSTLSAASPAARFQHAAVVLPNGRILVTGGLFRSSTPLAGGEIYDPGTNSWSLAPTMLVPRYGHALTALSDGRVIIMGGSNIKALSSVEIYFPYPTA